MLQTYFFRGSYKETLEGTQLAFTCSKLTIETLEQGVKYVRSNNKDARRMLMTSFWCLYC